MTERLDWGFDGSDYSTVGVRLIADLHAEAERTGSLVCPCVYCSYWADGSKCALESVWEYLRSTPSQPKDAQ